MHECVLPQTSMPLYIKSAHCSTRRFVSLPFERTNRSRLNQVGFSGEYRITYFHSATPMAAIPIALLPKESVTEWYVICQRTAALPRMATTELFAQVGNETSKCAKDKVYFFSILNMQARGIRCLIPIGFGCKSKGEIRDSIGG